MSYKGSKFKMSVYGDGSQQLVHQVDVIYSCKIPFDSNKVNYTYEMNSDGSVNRTVVRVQIPHKDDVSFAPSQYLHSQLFTCDNKGKC